jgi:hypothetical protein
VTPKARPESGAVPDDAAHALVSGVEVVVPLKELIDVEAELEELKARLAKNEEIKEILIEGRQVSVCLT